MKKLNVSPETGFSAFPSAIRRMELRSCDSSVARCAVRTLADFLTFSFAGPKRQHICTSHTCVFWHWARSRPFEASAGSRDQNLVDCGGRGCAFGVSLSWGFPKMADTWVFFCAVFEGNRKEPKVGQAFWGVPPGCPFWEFILGLIYEIKKKRTFGFLLAFRNDGFPS